MSAVTNRITFEKFMGDLRSTLGPETDLKTYEVSNRFSKERTEYVVNKIFNNHKFGMLLPSELDECGRYLSSELEKELQEIPNSDEKLGQLMLLEIILNGSFGPQIRSNTIRIFQDIEKKEIQDGGFSLIQKDCQEVTRDYQYMENLTITVEFVFRKNLNDIIQVKF